MNMEGGDLMGRNTETQDEKRQKRRLRKPQLGGPWAVSAYAYMGLT